MNLAVARAKLVTRHLTFSSPAKPTFTYAASFQHCSNSYTTKASKKEYASGVMWRDLVRNPLQWYDYRPHKLNKLVGVKHPDFKRKDTHEVLWVNSIPAWVLPGFESLKFDVKDVARTEDLWKSLVEEPNKWWDNRQLKTNPKAPDFVNRDNKEALWIGSAPSSVLPELNKLQFFDKKETKGDDLWKTLLEDPSKWWDNRVGKKNPKAPDFKHKETGEAFWISSAPSWVSTELDRLGSVKDVQWEGKKDAKGEDFWKSFLEDPSKWWDNRVRKKNPKAPDFKHKETGEALWANKIPDWVLAKLPPV